MVKKIIIPALCLCFLLGWTTHARAQDDRAAKVQAGFLLNFVKFVSWPAAGSGDLNIVVVGSHPFGKYIDSLQGKAVHGQTLSIDKVDGSSWQGSIAEAGVVFISQGVDPAPIIAACQGKAVLTVSNQEGFAAAGGIIETYKKGSKIGVRINKSTADSGGLKISAKLLKIAEVI